MTSNFIIKDQNLYNPVITVKYYFEKDNQWIIFIKLHNGKTVCIPKTTIQSNYIKDRNLLQEFIIDDWILKKLGLIKYYIKHIIKIK